MARHAPVRTSGDLTKTDYNVSSAFSLINALEDLIASVKSAINNTISLLTKRVEKLETKTVEVEEELATTTSVTHVYERTFTDATKNTIELESLNTASYAGGSYLIAVDCTETGFEFSGVLLYTGFGNDTAGAWKLLYWDKFSDKNTPTAPTYRIEVNADASTTKFRARITR